MKKLSKKYDLVVVGGGTAGCAAAYTAGKLGLKTLIIEKNIHLGGSITSALVIPAMQTSDKQINTNFFKALIKELQSINGQITYQNNTGWFTPELTKIALDNLMKKAGVDVLFNSTVDKVKIVNNCIKSIKIKSDILSVYIGATNVVDATGNCEIGKISNCNFLEKEDELQPISLRFEMGGINLEEFSNWLLDFDKDRNVTTVERINGQIHLSTACTDSGEWALRPLFEDAIEKNVLKATDCSYFQVFTIPGMPGALSFNCPRVFANPEINPLNPIDVSNALIEARSAILRLANFCKEYFPGFERAYISNIADAVGIRVSRRIKGKYIYTKKDLISGKKFKNSVLVGNYPIDIHSNNNKSKLEHTMQDYELPIEALQSADIENLYVAGRCLSADFEAQAALRIQPACFSMGEGIAKYIAKLN